MAFRGGYTMGSDQGDVIWNAHFSVEHWEFAAAKLDKETLDILEKSSGTIEWWETMGVLAAGELTGEEFGNDIRGSE